MDNLNINNCKESKLTDEKNKLFKKFFCNKAPNTKTVEKGDTNSVYTQDKSNKKTFSINPFNKKNEIEKMKVNIKNMSEEDNLKEKIAIILDVLDKGSNELLNILIEKIIYLGYGDIIFSTVGLENPDDFFEYICYVLIVNKKINSQKEFINLKHYIEATYLLSSKIYLD